jgi:hypothetical protein
MSDRKNAIRSFLEDDPELADDIGAFVVSLAEQVDCLQDSEAAAQWEPLRDLSLNLAREAERCGFPGLAQAARGVAHAAEDGKPEDARAGVVELTDLAQRIRLGHRGAA